MQKCYFYVDQCNGDKKEWSGDIGLLNEQSHINHEMSQLN
jgi:hypothetical protein